MKFKATKSDVVMALSRVVPVVDSRAPHFSQTHVLVTATDAGVSFSASNVASWATATVGDAKVKTPGAFGVAGKELLSRVQTMPTGDLEVEVKGSTLTVKAANRKHSLPCIHGGEFQSLPSVELPLASVTLPGATLAAVLARVVHARETDASRPEICGTCISVGAFGVRAESTDGHRFAIARKAHEAGAATAKVLLSARGEQVLAKACDGEDNPITLTIGDSKAMVTGPGFEVGATLLDVARFPDFDAMAPHVVKVSTTARVPREPLISALRSVSLAVSGDKSPHVDITIADGEMALRCESTVGVIESQDSLPVESSGKAAVSVMVHLLADALNALASEAVELGLGGARDVIVIKPIDDTLTETRLYVMPVAVG